MRVFIFLICLLNSFLLFSQEICDNGIDDDGDMLVDLNDTTDCNCAGLDVFTPIEYIPNGNFESYSQCPQGTGDFEGYVDDWFVPNNGTSDYLHSCGHTVGHRPPPPMGVTTFGIAGLNVAGSFFPKEFMAVCLNQPFLVGETYVVSLEIGFSNDPNNLATTLDLSLYGNAVCDEDETFNGVNYASDNWFVLSTVTETGEDEWKKVYFTFTPTVEVDAIMINSLSASGGTPSTWPPNYRYFYYDNIMVESTALSRQISIIYEDPCNLEDTLLSPTLPIATYQWYKDGIALVGETDSFLVNSAANYGEGWYQSRVSLAMDGCQDSDPLYFGQTETNAFDFSFDTSACAVKPLTITIDENYGTTTWNTGDSATTSIMTDSAGTYTATVAYDGGCSVSKSVVIDSVARLPIKMFYALDDIEGPYMELGDEIIYACPNFNVYFRAELGLDAPDYWSSPDYSVCSNCDTSTYVLSDDGIIVLNVLAPDCLYKDTAYLEKFVIDNGEVEYTTICEGESIYFQDSIYTNLSTGDVLYAIFEDINGCDSAVTMVITVEESFTSTWTSTADSCSSACTGAIIQTSTDGEAPITYNFWSNGSTDMNQFNLCAGNYYVTSTDNSGCTNEYSFVIPEYYSLSADYIVSDYNGFNLSCVNSADGMISINPQGGNGTVQVAWNDDPTTSTNRTGLSATEYTYTLTDSLNCNWSETISLNEPSPLTLTLSDAKNLVCYEAGDGGIAVEATGGFGDYTYQWTPNVSTSTLANSLQAGNYQIVVFDENNCSDNVSIALTEGAQIIPLVSTLDVSCFNFGDGSISIDSIANGIGQVYYKLDDNPFQAIMNFPITEDALSPGNYTLSVLDSNNCENSIELNIGSADSLTLSFSPNQDTTLSLGQVLELSAYSDNEDVVIQWSDNIPCEACPSYSFYPTQSTSIVVTALDTLTTCIKREQIAIELLEERAVYIPNAFSPNGDGHNDILTISARGTAITNIDEFSIFNRSGAMVYSIKNSTANDHLAGWDGRFNGQLSPEGVYIYYATITFIDGRTLTFQGDVSLMR